MRILIALALLVPVYALADTTIIYDMGGYDAQHGVSVSGNVTVTDSIGSFSVTGTSDPATGVAVLSIPSTAILPVSGTVIYANGYEYDFLLTSPGPQGWLVTDNNAFDSGGGFTSVWTSQANMGATAQGFSLALAMQGFKLVALCFLTGLMIRITKLMRKPTTGDV